MPHTIQSSYGQRILPDILDIMAQAGHPMSAAQLSDALSERTGAVWTESEQLHLIRLLDSWSTDGSSSSEPSPDQTLFIRRENQEYALAADPSRRSRVPDQLMHWEDEFSGIFRNGDDPSSAASLADITESRRPSGIHVPEEYGDDLYDAVDNDLEQAREEAVSVTETDLFPRSALQDSVLADSGQSPVMDLSMDSSGLETIESNPYIPDNHVRKTSAEDGITAAIARNTEDSHDTSKAGLKSAEEYLHPSRAERQEAIHDTQKAGLEVRAKRSLTDGDSDQHAAAAKRGRHSSDAVMGE